jgi:hypothetical protein
MGEWERGSGEEDPYTEVTGVISRNFENDS